MTLLNKFCLALAVFGIPWAAIRWYLGFDIYNELVSIWINTLASYPGIYTAWKE